MWKQRLTSGIFSPSPTCVCVLCVHYVCTYGGQTWISDIFLYWDPPYSLRQDLSLNLELIMHGHTCLHVCSGNPNTDLLSCGKISYPLSHLHSPSTLFFWESLTLNLQLPDLPNGWLASKHSTPPVCLLRTGLAGMCAVPSVVLGLQVCVWCAVPSVLYLCWGRLLRLCLLLAVDSVGISKVNSWVG